MATATLTHSGMNLVASSICFLNAARFFFVSVSKIAECVSLSRKRIASEVRYISLRTLATASAGSRAKLPLALIWPAMSPVIAPRAGTTCSFQARVRTYSDSVLRESSGAGPVAYLDSEACVVVAMAMNGVIWSAGMARLSAYAIGTVPIRISMIRPMPFWPSFEPWAKETPVQVSTSRPRIHHGGGVLPCGS